MQKNSDKFPVIICILSNIFLLICFYKNFLIFKYFGYFFSFIFLFFINRFICLFLWILCLSIDCYQFDLLPFKLTGILGEYIWIISKKIYFINIIIILILLCIYFYINYKKGNINDFLSISTKIKKIDLSIYVNDLIKKFHIKGHIYKKYFGPIYSVYYIKLAPTVKYNRFNALEIDFSAQLERDVKNTYDLEVCTISIENTEKYHIGFSELIKFSQTNCYLSIDIEGNPFLINVYENILIHHEDKLLLRSLLTSIVITRMNLEIIICGLDNELIDEFKEVFFATSDKNKTLEDAVITIEKRAHQITRNYKDIFAYQEKNDLCYIIIFINKLDNINIEILSFVLENGPKVGIFIVLFDNQIDPKLFKTTIQQSGYKTYKFQKGDFVKLISFPDNDQQNTPGLIDFLKNCKT